MTTVVRQALHAASAAVERNRPFRVTLQPPELGSLRVHIVRSDGAVTIRLDVETAAVRQVVQQHLADLHAGLARSGVAVDRIDVQLIEPRPPHQPVVQHAPDDARQPPNQRQRQHHAPDQPESPADSEDEATSETTPEPRDLEERERTQGTNRRMQS